MTFMQNNAYYKLSVLYGFTSGGVTRLTAQCKYFFFVNVTIVALQIFAATQGCVYNNNVVDDYYYNNNYHNHNSKNKQKCLY